VRIAISGQAGAQNWANVFHCQLTTSSSIIQSDLDAWTTAFAAAYKTNFTGVMANSVSFILAKAALYTPGGGILISSSAMTGNATSAGTAVADNSASKLVSWLSTVYWRGGKPRTYLPGPVTTDVTNNTTLVAGAITNLKTSGNAFRTAVNALTSGTITGTSLGFVSFSSGNTPRVTPLFFPITGMTVHGRLATQRRRLGKWQN
jgi:hypothetical protein